jgi:hypothetical protein
MRSPFIVFAVAFTLVCTVSASWAQVSAVEQVRAASDAFLAAYGAGTPGRGDGTANPSNPTLAINNLEALLAQFDDRATYAGTLQPFWIRGKDQISDLWARYFVRYPDRRMIYRDRNIEVFGNASVETGYAEMYMGDDARSSVVTFMRYSITRTLENNQWKIVNMMVDRLPSEQPARGTMPPWANTSASTALSPP